MAAPALPLTPKDEEQQEQEKAAADSHGLQPSGSEVLLEALIDGRLGVEAGAVILIADPACARVLADDAPVLVGYRTVLVGYHL